MLDKTKTGLLLLLLDHFQEIKGRTRIQKMLYLTDRIGWNAIKDYYFYQYGPFSEWVKRELDMLVQQGLIHENEMDIGDGKTLYEYKITPDGKKYLQTINLQPPDLVSKTKKFFEELRNYRTDDLEIMTSLYHMRKSDPEYDSNDRLVKLIKLYKPKFDTEQIEKNLEVFKIMEPYVKN